MAGRITRVITRQLLPIQQLSLVPFGGSCHIRNVFIASTNLTSGQPWPPWLTRGISSFHNKQSYRVDSRARLEEDNEYEVEEESLEGIRKLHRSTGTDKHANEEGKQFSDFPLDSRLLDKLETLGYSKPFEIQVATLEHTLAGRDVIARALTGSGKTLAFSIPIVQKLLQKGSTRSSRSPKAIVISPTRELCLQIFRSIEELNSRVRCVAVYGGDSINRQERALRRGADVICATPGRLNDHLERGNFDLNEVEFICLDEADELLTPGFKEQIEDVLRDSPSNKQVMLFSATMPPHIRAITKRYMSDPAFVDITANQQYKAPESVRHLCMRVPPAQNLLVVKHLIEEHQPERCIVFMETKQKTSDAAHVLRRSMGLKADGIHSDLSQSRRENIMSAFRTGLVKVLVATDVAARGLDIPEVDLVIQVSPPRNGTEYYIHRSGRTGRAGRDGLAVMLHCGNQQDWSVVREIEKLVPMKHVTPPNQEGLHQAAAASTLEELRRRADRRSQASASLLPLVEQLPPADTQRLLAAAVSWLAQGGEYENHGGQRRGPPPRSGRPDAGRGLTARRGRPIGSGGGGGGGAHWSMGRRSGGLRGRDNDDDDDDDAWESHTQRSSPQGGTRGRSDWDGFY